MKLKFKGLRLGSKGKSRKIGDQRVWGFKKLKPYPNLWLPNQFKQSSKGNPRVIMCNDPAYIESLPQEKLKVTYIKCRVHSN